MINELAKALIDSTRRTYNDHKFTKSKKLKHSKRKKWWDDNLKQLHIVLVQKYVQYRDSDFDKELKFSYHQVKKQFRAQKRFNQKLLTDRNLKRINELFKLDKNSFWKRLKSMQRSNGAINVSL